MRGKSKYYVVIHGKCPGIYDDWDRVQDNIKGFKNGEYCSKSSKASAIEFFHSKRPDWPVHNIPDFTFHASNRLRPLKGSVFSQPGDLRKVKKMSMDSDTGSGSSSGDYYDRKLQRSSSLSPKVSDLETGHISPSESVLSVPTSHQRPEKIVLQQNWLEESPATPSPYFRSPTPAPPLPRTGHPAYHHQLSSSYPMTRSHSVNEMSSFGNSLLPPRPDEIEFDRASNFYGERSTMGIRSPAPLKRLSGDNGVNFPAIAGASNPMRKKPSGIELFPAPGAIRDQGSPHSSGSRKKEKNKSKSRHGRDDRYYDRDKRHDRDRRRYSDSHSPNYDKHSSNYDGNRKSRHRSHSKERRRRR